MGRAAVPPGIAETAGLTSSSHSLGSGPKEMTCPENSVLGHPKLSCLSHAFAQADLSSTAARGCSLTGLSVTVEMFQRAALPSTVAPSLTQLLSRALKMSQEMSF